MEHEHDTVFLQHLAAQTGFSTSVCQRLVQDILAEYNETLEAFVQHRHRDLRATGELKNEQIYARILAEIPNRRFCVDPLTTRQIRRLIYG